MASQSATTLARYEAQGLKGKTRPLVKQGFLRSLIFADADRSQARVGSNMEYSGVMQFGAARGAFGHSNGRPVPWGNIPARPFLGLSDQDQRNILDMVDETLADITEM